MILRFVSESMRRSPRRKALMVGAIAMGSAVATSMLGVMLGIGDKINRELRTAGANISVTATGAGLTGGVGIITTNAAGGDTYIPQNKVLAIKSIFWGLNITGIAPSLEARDGAIHLNGVWFNRSFKSPDGSVQYAGIRPVNPAWQVSQGRWATDNAPTEIMVGAGIARRQHWSAGQTVPVLGTPFKVAGVLSTGDDADDQVFVPLERLQELVKRNAQVDRIQVAALTKPEDDFARKDPQPDEPPRV